MLKIIKYILKLQIICIFVAYLAINVYPIIFGRRLLDTTNLDDKQEQHKLFTREELALYDGIRGELLYLALLGRVYDVSKSKSEYGPGGIHNMFIGRDASIFFVATDFEAIKEQDTDDVIMLYAEDLIRLANWKSFFDMHYNYKGKLVGRFYDESGAPTTYYQKYIMLLRDAQNSIEISKQLHAIYPKCNMEWNVGSGTKVWCPNYSKGKQLKVRYPRKLFDTGSNSYLCGCIAAAELDATDVTMQHYRNCHPLSTECYY